jgi:hypothetical protein
VTDVILDMVLAILAGNALFMLVVAAWIVRRACKHTDITHLGTLAVLATTEPGDMTMRCDCCNHEHPTTQMGWAGSGQLCCATCRQEDSKWKAGRTK